MAQRHKGEPMPNPMTGFNFNFDALTGKTEFKLFDKYYVGNDPNPKYEEFKVTGKPVNINNIHEAIVSSCHCRFKFHLLYPGISIIIKGKIFVVELPTYNDELSS